MSAINHASAEQNSAQTRAAGTYAAITGASIASGSFTAGKKYLLLITAQMKNDTAGALVKVKTVHGSTDFAESEQIHEPQAATEWGVYQFFDVWTAVSSEDVHLEFSTGGTGTARVDQVAMHHINLSDDVTENTDWFLGSRSNDDTLSTTPTDGGAITFTPGGASDWLVLTYAQIDVNSTSAQAQSFIERSGEASSSAPRAGYESGNTGAVQGYMLLRAYALTAVSNTFKERSQTSTGTGHVRLHSKVFALNLEKFRNHAFQYVNGDQALSATAYATQLATVSITPAVSSDVLVLAFHGAARKNTGREEQWRVQVDNADQPAGQTTDAYIFDPGTDAIDEGPLPLVTLVAGMTAAAHTIDLDASADSATAAPAGKDACLVAFTLELASSAATLAAGNQGITVTAPTAALAAGAVTLAAGATAVTATAPSSTVAGGLTLQAGNQGLVLEAPSSTLVAVTALAAGVQAVTVQAPVATLAMGPVTLAAGPLTALVEAPAPTVGVGGLVLVAAAAEALLEAPAAQLSTDTKLPAGPQTAILEAPVSALGLGPIVLAAGLQAAVLEAPAAVLEVGPVVFTPAAAAVLLEVPAPVFGIVTGPAFVRVRPGSERAAIPGAVLEAGASSRVAGERAGAATIVSETVVIGG